MGRHLARASPSCGDRRWPRHTLQSSTPGTPRGPTEGGSIAAAARGSANPRERVEMGNGVREAEKRRTDGGLVGAVCADRYCPTSDSWVCGQ